MDRMKLLVKYFTMNFKDQMKQFLYEGKNHEAEITQKN